MKGKSQLGKAAETLKNKMKKAFCKSTAIKEAPTTREALPCKRNGNTTSLCISLIHNIFFFSIALLLVAATASAVPQNFSIQGRLTDDTNTVVTGSYNFIFRLYDAATAGNIVWAETHSTQGVINGLFNIVVGDENTATTLNDIDLNTTKWLEISVNNEAQSPRIKLTPTTAAQLAQRANALNSSASDSNFSSIGVTQGAYLNRINATGDANIANAGITGGTFLNTITATGDSNFSNISASYCTLQKVDITGDANIASIGITGNSFLNALFATTVNATGDSNFTNMGVSGNLFANNLNISGATIGTDSNFTNIGTSGNTFMNNASVAKDQNVSGTGKFGALNTGVILKHVNGTETYYRPTADTNTARGTALLAAQTAAAVGETIFVGPGIYSINTALGKNGVNWWFAPGADINALGASVFADGGTPMVFSVGGEGSFTSDQDTINPTNADSNWTIHCKSVVSANYHLYGAIGGTAGTVYLTATEIIESTGYDAILTNGGTYYITTPLIKARDNCVESSGATFYMNVDKMLAVSEVVNGETRGYWRVKELRSLTASQTVLSTGGGGVIDFDLIITENSNAVSANGTFTLKGGTIQTLGDASAAIYLDGEGMILRDVKIIAGSAATYSITGMEQPFEMYGNIQVNKPIDIVNAPILGDGMYYDSSTDITYMEKLTATEDSNFTNMGVSGNLFANSLNISGATIGTDSNFTNMGISGDAFLSKATVASDLNVLRNGDFNKVCIGADCTQEAKLVVGTTSTSESYPGLVEIVSDSSSAPIPTNLSSGLTVHADFNATPTSGFNEAGTFLNTTSGDYHTSSKNFVALYGGANTALSVIDGTISTRNFTVQGLQFTAYNNADMAKDSGVTTSTINIYGANIASYFGYSGKTISGEKIKENAYGSSIASSISGTYNTTQAGNNYGAYISTSDSLDNASTGTVNNYSLYLSTPATSTKTSGGQVISYGLYGASDVNNVINGKLRIGSTNAPTSALDVSGSVIITGDLNVTGNVGISGVTFANNDLNVTDDINAGGTVKGAKFKSWDANAANGAQAVALGYKTTAHGNQSTALGYQTTASGRASTAMGISTNATAAQSIATGEYTTASGTDSIAMGYNTTAGGNGSMAAGYNDGGTMEATGLGSMTTGVAASSDLSPVTRASGDGSLATGYNLDGTMTASGNGSTTGGYADYSGTITASGKASEARGYSMEGAITASAIGSMADGYAEGGGTIEAIADAGKAAGYCNAGVIRAGGSGSAAWGYSAEGTTAATGTGSTAIGYNELGAITASGGGSMAGGYVSEGGAITASGTGSMAYGYSGGTLQATQNGAIALGYNTQSLAEAAVTLGKNLTNYNANSVLVQDLNALDSVYAVNFVDLTPGWTGSSQDALEQLLRVRTNEKGNIDHSTLPEFVQAKLPNQVSETTGMGSMQKSLAVEAGQQDSGTGRNLGAMMTMLTEAVKALDEKIEAKSTVAEKSSENNEEGKAADVQDQRMDALEEENRMLREELCARDNSYSWCEEKAAVQAKADIVGSGQDSGEGQQDANISVEDSAASTGQQDAGENQAAGDQAGTDGNGLCVVSAAGCNEINDGNGTPHDANNADLNAGFAAIGSSVWGFFSAMFGI